MHLPDDALPRRGPALDPLRGAPPPGMWVLWHGDKARAVLDACRALGRLALPEERAGLRLPEGFPAPLQREAQAWVLEAEAGRWLIREDSSGDGYVSAYVVGLAPESAPDRS